MDQNAEVESILAAIEEAFASVSRGVVTLHEAEVIDHYGNEKERQRAQARDPEQDWRDIPDASIQACPNALPHLDPVSWCFYLPAFMSFGLRRLKSPRSSIDRVIYALALGDDREINDHQRRRFERLDEMQVRAVQRFLDFTSNHEAHCDALIAKEALQKYWSRAAGV